MREIIFQKSLALVNRRNVELLIIISGHFQQKSHWKNIKFTLVCSTPYTIFTLSCTKWFPSSKFSKNALNDQTFSRSNIFNIKENRLWKNLFSSRGINKMIYSKRWLKENGEYTMCVCVPSLTFGQNILTEKYSCLAWENVRKIVTQ